MNVEHANALIGEVKDAVLKMEACMRNGNIDKFELLKRSNEAQCLLARITYELACKELPADHGGGFNAQVCRLQTECTLIPK